MQLFEVEVTITLRACVGNVGCALESNFRSRNAAD